MQMNDDSFSRYLSHRTKIVIFTFVANSNES